jgi:epoxyqueuosine reductase
MRCQLVCPVNKNQVGKIVPGPLFSEEETDLLLRKPPLDKLPEELRRKLAAIAMDDSYDVFARNLDVLMKSQDLRPPTP